MLKSVFSFVALAVTLSAAAEHKGIVFADSNANGVMDGGERPLKGVKYGAQNEALLEVVGVTL